MHCIRGLDLDDGTPDDVAMTEAKDLIEKAYAILKKRKMCPACSATALTSLVLMSLQTMRLDFGSADKLSVITDKAITMVEDTDQPIEKLEWPVA